MRTHGREGCTILCITPLLPLPGPCLGRCTHSNAATETADRHNVKHIPPGLPLCVTPAHFAANSFKAVLLTRGSLDLALFGIFATLFVFSILLGWFCNTAATYYFLVYLRNRPKINSVDF